MSYVLDALRRAEADRHRGQVPDLHAVPQAGLGAAAAPVAPARRWRLAALVLVAAGLVGGSLWLWRKGEGRDPVPDEPAPATSVPDPTPVRVAPPMRDAPAAAVPPPVALPTTPPVRRPAPDAVLPLASPPAMSFGGAFDSPDPKARMLIINGQIWREGDEPLPGWVLERITLHAARFRHQGRTVEVPYAGGAARRP